MKGVVVNIKYRDCEVYIGRKGKGQSGYFGNPIRRGYDCMECGVVHATGGSTLPCFERYARKRMASDAEYRSRVAGLHGKVLGCFCAPAPCHGDILIKLAAELVGN